MSRTPERPAAPGRAPSSRGNDADAAYAVGGFRDRQQELERLRVQARAFLAEERPILERLGLPDEGRFLDVGCGPGFVAEALGEALPGLEVFGVDLDRTVLPRRGRFAAAQAGRLPLDQGRFAAAYARLVLRHVPDPGLVVGEMARVLAPGGRALLADTDDGGLVLSPMPPGFPEVLAARHAGFRRRGADPEVGRRLPGLLQAAGLDDIRIEVLPVHSGRLGPAAFAAIVLAPIADAVDPDLLAPDRVLEVARELEGWAAQPGAFGALTVVLASGRRPDGPLEVAAPRTDA